MNYVESNERYYKIVDKTKEEKARDIKQRFEESKENAGKVTPYGNYKLVDETRVYGDPSRKDTGYDSTNLPFTSKWDIFVGLFDPKSERWEQGKYVPDTKIEVNDKSAFWKEMNGFLTYSDVSSLITTAVNAGYNLGQVIDTNLGQSGKFTESLRIADYENRMSGGNGAELSDIATIAENLAKLHDQQLVKNEEESSVSVNEPSAGLDEE